MAKGIGFLAVLLAIGVLVAFSAAPASAQETTPQPAAGEYPDVSGVQPFTAGANYMSLPGYLRWLTFRDQGLWLTRAEARRIVEAQTGRRVA